MRIFLIWVVSFFTLSSIGCAGESHGKFVVGGKTIFNYSSDAVLVKNNIQGTIVKGVTAAGNPVFQKVGKNEYQEIILTTGQTASIDPGYWRDCGGTVEITADVYDLSGKYLGVARHAIYYYGGGYGYRSSPEMWVINGFDSMKTADQAKDGWFY